ncbi:MAG: pilus assembly protein PilM [Candidatus Nitrohelix vancouverensis]|uniref:Pilus assembly protein PilM n=1 Tax=Candidatus Nitrohelix vancouverensis TaxID=2705534 RepID=A0A7T0C276_9BACT|nr:MAG: pilus assembly protein PilM [Candidatus Nitrohelix vancouverensis]
MKLQLPSKINKINQPSIGLDIGFNSIKVVEIISREKGFEIVRFGLTEIPAEIAQEKKRAPALGALIRRMFSENNIKGKKVYISVSGHNVVIRTAVLPKMPLDELKDAIKWNAREEVLFDLEKADIAYHIVKETEIDGSIFYEVLTVFVREDVIPFMVDIVRQAGLQPLGVTVVPMALWDYDLAVNTVKPHQVTSYIDMGSERTRVYFVSESQLLFSREIPNGGKNITASLVGDYEIENRDTVTVDEVRAETIKKTFGLPAEDAAGKTEEGIPLTVIRERILPVVTKQVEEFNRSIEYFKNKYKTDKVHRLIISGGGVGLKGMYQLLDQSLDMEIDRCNTLFQAKTGSLELTKEQAKMIGPSLTAAAGLAVGQCSKIDLLPERFKFSVKKLLIKLAPFAFIPFLLAGMASYSMQLREEIKVDEKKLEENKALLASLQNKLGEMQGPKKEIDGLENKIQNLKREKRSFPGSSSAPVDFWEILEEIAMATGSNVSLSQLHYTDASFGKEDDEEEGLAPQLNRLMIRLQGNIFGEDLGAQVSLRNFLEDLRKSPAFKEIHIIKTEPVKDGRFTSPGLTFELNLIPHERNTA